MKIGKAISIRIKDLLQKTGMTQYRLEQRSGILHGTMHSIMKGNNNDIELGTIIMLAKGFDMNFKDFLNDELFLSEELEYE